MADAKTTAAAAPSWPESAFWAFSVDLYRRPGVEAACLALQDRRGLDVNLLLWTLWLADCGVALDRQTLARAEDAVGSWQTSIVGALRTVRRELRQRLERADAEDIAGRWPRHVEALRGSVLELELDGEHLAQMTLGRLGDELEPSRRASAGLAGGNLACLGGFEGEDRGDLAKLLKQVFPDTRQTHLDAALDGVVSGS